MNDSFEAPLRGSYTSVDQTDLIPRLHFLVEEEPRIVIYNWCKSTNLEWPVFYPTKTHIWIPVVPTRLSHEIGHWVEMKSPKRWFLPDLGMSNDPDGFTPKSFWAAYAREVRVRTLQSLIGDSHNCILTSPKGESYDHSSWGWGGRSSKYFPFGRFKTRQNIIDWEQDLISKTKNNWPVDRIVHEWKIRLAAWRHQAETT